MMSVGHWVPDGRDAPLEVNRVALGGQQNVEEAALFLNNSTPDIRTQFSDGRTKTPQEMPYTPKISLST